MAASSHVNRASVVGARPDVVVGLKGQVARFGYSSSSSRKGPLHGRRANVTFVA